MIQIKVTIYHIISMVTSSFYKLNMITLTMQHNFYGNSRLKQNLQPIQCLPLTEFFSRDLIAVDLSMQSFTICSAFLPYNFRELPPTVKLRRLVEKTHRKRSPAYGYANANNRLGWDSNDNNCRGENLLEFLFSNNLQVSNVGNQPTFVNRIRFSQSNHCIVVNGSAYQVGTSCTTALSDLDKAKASLASKGIALCAFLDIEGAFDNQLHNSHSFQSCRERMSKLHLRLD